MGEEPVEDLEGTRSVGCGPGGLPPGVDSGALDEA